MDVNTDCYSPDELINHLQIFGTPQEKKLIQELEFATRSVETLQEQNNQLEFFLEEKKSEIIQLEETIAELEEELKEAREVEA
ncbi:hypothetical protein [Aliikangiella coralliicola]|uniref:Uncharacterized protein n=1 Tax=Aliikangiella coralliicola TaxID=2592383 RepID=A0A545U029_9GAMM|nr:hypothetical protein [Aliikangiella coralliicola]TQV82819.1 hypothetical protein FLL46_23920 [Aliikangiella coralliicola]